MLTEIRASIRPALVLLLILTLITGIAYPLAMTGVTQAAMPFQANGSLIRAGDRIVGSELIGQGFADDRYFQGRPSAAGENGYDASASVATNLAPGSKDLRDAIAVRVAESGLSGNVPPDYVTTSGSGLDPHISPEAAFAQVRRVAASRGLDETAVRSLVERSVETPLLGFLGERRVNVLLLNRQLDTIPVNASR